jgi:ubiquinone/menaquinone biosynthesis C-methylase UbiE
MPLAGLCFPYWHQQIIIYLVYNLSEKIGMNNNEKGRIMNNIDHKISTIWTKYGVDDRERRTNTPAEIYEQHLVPAMFEPFARDLIQLSDIRRSDRILDVACGTGIVSRLAIDYVDVSVGKVVGIDINPIMLNMARHCSVGKDIEWKEGSALSMPFPNESFDLVICQQGLQFFPDRLKALTEMNRVLAGATHDRGDKYCGRLVLSVWTSIKDSPGFHILERLLQETISHEAATIMQLPHSLSDSAELISVVKAAGFGKISSEKVTKTISFPSVEEFVVEYTNGSMLASYFSDKRKVDDISWNKLLNGASSELSQFVDERSRRLSFPLSTCLIFASKNS